MAVGDTDGPYPRRSKNALATILVAAILLTFVFIGLSLWLKNGTVRKEGTGPEGKSPSEMVTRLPVTPRTPVVNYDRLAEDGDLAAEMERRKAEYGLTDSVDMIVRADESVRIGGQTLSMEEILDKIRLGQGEIVEKDIKVGDQPLQGHDAVFAIHVVQPQDNIWNIHFGAMREIFGHRGITLSPMADEPDVKGYSSGVGKILKFSENIVYIYNLKENRLDYDPNLLEPLSKVVIYNLGRLSALLDQIDYEKVDRVHFDGETLWIPAKS